MKQLVTLISLAAALSASAANLSFDPSSRLTSPTDARLRGASVATGTATLTNTASFGLNTNAAQVVNLSTALTPGGTVTISMTNAPNYYTLNLTNDTTFAFSDSVNGVQMLVSVITDGTHLVNFPASIQSRTSTNQPFAAGLTTLLFERTGGTNYVSVSPEPVTLTIKTTDNTPLVAASTIIFPKNSLTDNGGGSTSFSELNALWGAHGPGGQRRMAQASANGGAALSSLFDTTVTETGNSASAASTTQPVCVNYTSGASTGNQAGWGGQLQFPANRFPIKVSLLTRIIQTNAVRHWVACLANATFANTLVSDSPTASLIGFRYIDTSGVNWFFCTKDGTTITATDTGVPASVALVHFAWEFDGTTAIGYIDGTAVATNTTHLPLTTAIMAHNSGVETREAVAKSIRFAHFEVITK